MTHLRVYRHIIYHFRSCHFFANRKEKTEMRSGTTDEEFDVAVHKECRTLWAGQSPFACVVKSLTGRIATGCTIFLSIKRPLACEKGI